ncbi:hypothetical protein GIB67_042670 [Kingdonia uniflora]|uniref:ABC transporter domain-containing protein n=1 Tax=Kingdonia uniflora TaxID=39325 RepID=A0A7J7P2H8_9MAGN|nr:hypothetical protein GIB67_042670 [Kingdonia uniflora]
MELSAGVFNKSSRRGKDDEDEELKWVAIERLPTYDRMRIGVLKQVLDNGNVWHTEIDFTKLKSQDNMKIIENALKFVEEDNEWFLLQVGIETPKIEVRFENLSIEGDAYALFRILRLSPSKKRINTILQDVNGIVKPSRMTLFLGPPNSGKTSFLQALSGKLDNKLRVTGKITYCGHNFSEFVPQRTCAYISQHDLYHCEMIVREILDFSRRGLGVGTRFDMLAELSRREKEAGIKPDPEIDVLMKATTMKGKKSSLVTDYVLKILGLDICADIHVGDEMRREISDGQNKRVTTGTYLVKIAREAKLHKEHLFIHTLHINLCI